MSPHSIDYSRGGLDVAVIGGGISGIMAAHLISRRNRVTIFEAEARLGGHTHTHMADTAAGPMPVDMGFIVFNDANYPTFNRFLDRLGVARELSDMSFAFHDPATGFMYAGTGLRGMFARPRNLVSPTFWRMAAGMVRFGREAKGHLKSGRMRGKTIGQYMDDMGYSHEFRDSYLLPMAGAIWSAPDGKALDFPAEALVRFFDNHLLLNPLKAPQWYFVAGGSQTYVRAFQKGFRGDVRVGSPVRSVSRDADGADVTTDAVTERFDAVVMATHADVSRRLLSDPSDDEDRLLSPWSYAPNRVMLHTDQSFLPPNRAAWASWVFVKDPNRPDDAPVGVSYHMNRLQNLGAKSDYIVTLNPVREAKRPVLEDVVFDHPQYSLASMATQAELPSLDGVNRTFFCGAYQYYGFHEDGARSGTRVASHFGETL